MRHHVLRISAVVSFLFGFPSYSAAEAVKVFILAGNSNMTGTASADNLPSQWNAPQDDVWIWLDRQMTGGQWTNLGPGHGWSTHAPRPNEPEPLDPRNGVGPELSIGRRLADAFPNHRIALIKHGDGGGSLTSEWNPQNPGPPNSSDHRWSGLQKKTSDAFQALNDAGHTYEVEGLFLSLGGGDARNYQSGSSDPAEVEAGRQEALQRSAAYADNLTEFIDAARSEYASDLPFIYSLTPHPDDVPPALLAAFPGAGLVREGQIDVDNTVALTGTFSTEGIPLRDRIHFDAPGQIEFGNRFVDSYFDVTAVPEPSSLFVLTGVAMIGLVRRRRCKLQSL